jgi:HD-GYP domain-containing protein (c-di-GMP phosphodiesterase class II)
MLGLDGAIETLRSRTGELDPELSRLFLLDALGLTRDLDAPSLWDCFLDEEPGHHPLLAAGALAGVAEVCAKYVDHKSPFTLGHSTGVAELAVRAGRALGLGREEREHVRVAALLHDLGRCGVPNGIWDKPARLTRMERQRVEMHSYLTETILAACPTLQPFGSLAGAAHERADGSGYHRRVSAVPAGAALVAAADVYHALTEERPWRAALAAKQAAATLLDEVEQGRLARDAAHAVLEAAGHRQKTTRAAWPAGLSNREAEVLCWVARGLSNKEIAARLHLSAKTVEHHVEHVYEKTGVRSRAAAAIFAMEQGMLRK